MNPQNQNMEDIHEIQTLWDVAFPWLTALAVGLVLLGVLGLIFWFLRRWLSKRAQKKASFKAPERRQSPREKALSALKQLSAQNPAAFYLQVEAILKSYLEAIYTESAIDHSLAELAQFLKQQPKLVGTESQWQDVLQKLAGSESVATSLESLGLSPQNEHYEKLNQILTHFLNRTQSMQATGFTATELVLFLRQQAGPQGPNHEIEALLERGTRAKFATEQIAESAMQKDLKSAQQFIQTYTL